jgi:hypothetical protein
MTHDTGPGLAHPCHVWYLVTTMTSYIIRFGLFLTFPVAFIKGLGDITLSKDEIKTLNSKWLNYIWQSNFSQSFLAWRRRLLYTACVFLGIGAIFYGIRIRNQCNGIFGDGSRKAEQFYTQTQPVTSNGFPSSAVTPIELTKYTTLGSLGLISQNISPFIALCFVLIAAWFWVDYNKSRQFLFIGWISSLFFVVWPNIIPVKYLIEETTFQESALLGVVYSLGILPLYLALISGLAVGSQRVYFFAPSPLTGAMILISALFSIIIPFAAMSLLVQLIGNFILIIGIYFLIAGPFWLVIRSKQFTTLTTFQSTDTIKSSHLTIHIASALRQVGLLVIVGWCISKIVWAFNNLDTTDAEEAMVANFIVEAIPYGSLVGKMFEFLGSMTFQAVLWTDIIIHIARNDDVKMIKLQSDLAFN